jgi:hypothetical protein
VGSRQHAQLVRARVARLGALERPIEHRGLVAEEDGRLIGLLTYVVDDSRARLKREIPEIGDHGIPLRDELELELDLPSWLQHSVTIL